MHCTMLRSEVYNVQCLCWSIVQYFDWSMFGFAGLQYDAKLLKLQKQNSKNQCGQSSSSSINHEIFRRVYMSTPEYTWLSCFVTFHCRILQLFCSDLLQKLQHAKAESDREIAALKRQVSDLERQLATVNKRRRLWTHWRVQETICTISSSQL